MLRHLVKIIWNERRTNAWIVAELIIVFVIMWFCIEYVYFMGVNYFEPTGFDNKHTYVIEMGRKEVDENNVSFQLSPDDEVELANKLMDLVLKYPGIESVGLSKAAIPYTYWNMSTGYVVDNDTTSTNFRQYYVSPGFFDVYKLNIISGKVFNWNDPASDNQVLITADRYGKINSKEKSYELKDVRILRKNDYDKSSKDNQVIGYLDRLKQTYFGEYANVVIHPLQKGDVRLSDNEISIRVSPNADKDFKERFTRDMREKLNLEPYFLVSLNSTKDQMEQVDKWHGISSSLKSVYSIGAFLIINIFLGIIGTFWVRTSSRKSEIGLRLSLGASKKDIMRLFFSETFLLILFSSLIAVLLCIHIGQTDLLLMIGIPKASLWQIGAGFEQNIINYFLTLLFLVIISFIAVWYPARKASEIEPAQSLRDE